MTFAMSDPQTRKIMAERSTGTSRIFSDPARLSPVCGPKLVSTDAVHSRRYIDEKSLLSEIGSNK